MKRKRRTHAEMEHAVWVASRGGVTDLNIIAKRVRLRPATVEAIIRRCKERAEYLDKMLAIMDRCAARRELQALQARATTQRNHETGEER